MTKDHGKKHHGSGTGLPSAKEGELFAAGVDSDVHDRSEKRGLTPDHGKPAHSHRTRCPWPGNDPLYVDYHDREWGVPLRDDQALFELFILETFQAGLSWHLILKRRENFRQAFNGFDPHAMAAYTGQELTRLMADPGIIRNRLKIEAARSNARAFLALAERHGSFAHYLWDFVDHSPIVNTWETIQQVPATTPLSDAVSRALKREGFRFVGSTTVYAFLQSAGLVNDHLVACFRHAEVSRATCGGFAPAPRQRGRNHRGMTPHPGIAP